MCYKRGLETASILLLGVIALIVTEKFSSHVRAGRPAVLWKRLRKDIHSSNSWVQVRPAHCNRS
jgi:hypothetical protein